MKFYILTDLEGPAGVSRFTQTRVDSSPEKDVAVELLTEEVNACVDGLLTADPNAEIVVWDGHGTGGIDCRRLHRDAQLIARGPIGPPYFLDETFDGHLFVGQHAMAGTPAAPLSHTYSSLTVEYYKINGVAYGEFGCRAALAGALGVPTIFLAGDDKACLEAEALVPNIVTVATKVGLGQELARHLSPLKSRELIRAGAEQAVRRLPEIAPFVIPGPYTQEIRVLEGCEVSRYLLRGARMIDRRTCVREADQITDLFI